MKVQDVMQTRVVRVEPGNTLDHAISVVRALLSKAESLTELPDPEERSPEAGID